MNKIATITTFLIPLSISGFNVVPAYAIDDNKPLLIEEKNKTETQTSLTIDNINCKKIRLPNGTWSKDKLINYAVTRNGSYDFVSLNENGKEIVNTYEVKNLRKNLLVTNKRDVFLLLRADDTLSGVSDFRLKNETDNWTSYEKYSLQNGQPNIKKSWQLSPSEGLKSVFVQYKDNAGNETTQVYDQIYLDLSGPEIKDFIINNNEKYTNNRNIKLKLSATDNFSEVSKLLVSNDNQNWKEVNYSNNIDWTLNPGAGNKTVYIKAVDNLGNIGKVHTASIYFDDVLPQGSIHINNNASITNSRKVKLQLDFKDIHSGVKRVSIFEKDKSYTFPQVPNSPVEVDWTLSMGNKGMVSLEIEDNAGNVFRTDSNIIQIATLEINQFRLTNVVNPSNSNNTPFKPIKWDFPPQKMLAGANIEFDVNYSLDLDKTTTATFIGRYNLEVIGDNGYHKVINQFYDSSILNGFKTKVTLPTDAPKGAKVFLTTNIKADLKSGNEIFSNEANFPGNGEKALIGVIEGNIKEGIKFNEIA